LSNKKKKKDEEESIRQPWIQRKTGFIAITVLSVILAGWIAWQMISMDGNIGRGILWGIIYGGSIWLVFFGMNFFHSLFNKKPKK